MDSHTGQLNVRPSRIEQLEADFAALAPKLPDGAERKALSLLHGMVQELWRVQTLGSGNQSRSGPTIEDIVDLHEHAPAMEGDARNTPLAVVASIAASICRASAPSPRCSSIKAALAMAPMGLQMP